MFTTAPCRRCAVSCARSKFPVNAPAAPPCVMKCRRDSRPRRSLREITDGPKTAKTVGVSVEELLREKRPPVRSLVIANAQNIKNVHFHGFPCRKHLKSKERVFCIDDGRELSGAIQM